MPKPEAAFSPFTTTKSRSRRWRNPGRWAAMASRPGRPTTSPSITSRTSPGSPSSSGPTRSPLLTPLRPDDAALGYHEVERLVGRLAGYHRHLLGGIGEADGQDIAPSSITSTIPWGAQQG